MHSLIRRGNLSSVAILGLLWIASVSAALAQGTSFITGSVYDPSQNPVANASVQITNDVTGTTFNVNTTDTGLYRSPAVDPGSYTVRVVVTGFKEAVYTGVRVEIGNPRSLDVSLQVDTTQTSVTVTASAPLLNTENPGLGQAVDYAEVAKLPYFDRSAGAPACPHPRRALYRGRSNLRRSFSIQHSRLDECECFCRRDSGQWRPRRCGPDSNQSYRRSTFGCPGDCEPEFRMD
jgi:Carboxypeptidase regulatory-like domain